MDIVKQEKTDRSQYFVRGAFRRFFIPAVISGFWMAIAGVVDSIFVGNSIGTAGLAAISLGQPVYLFYNILSYGFSIGGSIHYAAKLAQGREEEGNQIFMSVLELLLSIYVVTVALGLLFLPQLMRVLGADPADAVARTYIRTQLIFVPIMFCQGPFYYFVNADNGPELAAVAMSVSGLLDTLFSYIFIVRMHLGVAGSVYSTVVGAVVMLSMTGWHIVTHRGALHFKRTKINWFAAGLSARTGFATSVRYLFEFITMIAVNRLLIKMGGASAVAAFDVIYNISILCASITDSVSVATEPMFSSYHSERNLRNILFTIRLALIWAGILSLVYIFVLTLFAPGVSVLFGMREGLDLMYATEGIRIFALSVLPAMLNAVFCSYYQSILREWLAYIITFLRSFIFYLLALFLCARNGMDSIWFIFATAEVMTLLAWIPIAVLRGGFFQLRGIDVSHVRTATIDSSSQDVGLVVSGLQEFYEDSISDPRLVMYIGLTIEEICCAIIERFRDQMGEIYIQVTVVVENGECTLYLRDNALAFNPLAASLSSPDLESDEGLELMGVRIVQKRAKEFFYRRFTGFNTLVIRL